MEGYGVEVGDFVELFFEIVEYFLVIKCLIFWCEWVNVCKFWLCDWNYFSCCVEFYCVRVESDYGVN